MIKNKTGSRIGLFAGLIAWGLCFTAGLQSASAQSGTVVMPVRETTVKQALIDLQRQTNYKVVLDWEKLDPDKTVFFPAHRLQVSELLKICFAGYGLEWEVAGKQIIITNGKPRAEEPAPAPLVFNGSNGMHMTFVPDPYSKTQEPFEELFSRNEWDDENDEVDSLTLAIVNYRVNSSKLEADYMQNARSLSVIRNTLTNKKVLARLDHIIITAGSSPEGNTDTNEKLAAARALSLKSYLMWQYPYLDRNTIYTFSVGEDWSGLRKLVYEDHAVPFREDVLDIIDNVKGNDAKRNALKTVGAGDAYRYMTANILPQLRGAAAATFHFKSSAAPKIVETRVDTVYIERAVDTVYVDRLVEKEVVVEKIVEVGTKPDFELEKKPLFAVKTNLLFDVASALNVEIEIPIGKRWSIAAEYIFPWWLWENKQYALQTLSGNLEGRYWFGDRETRPQLTGWFVGLYTGGGYYDVEWGNKGYQGEFFIAAGLSGGYAHTIGKRNDNWRMEYSLGVGYMQTKYRKYVPKYGLDNEWHLIRQNDGRYSWIGPTRAKISLVWMLNHGYRKKGESK